MQAPSGAGVGRSVGLGTGAGVGRSVGLGTGAGVGRSVGLGTGVVVGRSDGAVVGLGDGFGVGGAVVGLDEGRGVGGAVVGFDEGRGVGAGDRASKTPGAMLGDETSPALKPVRRLLSLRAPLQAPIESNDGKNGIQQPDGCPAGSRGPPPSIR
jgi:hypothetical protein